MKEIEILVEVFDTVDTVKEKLSKFKYEGLKTTQDVYYYDPKRENLKPNENLEINECLRLRTKNNNYYITYKVDKFDENKKWLYSDEYETKVEDYNMLCSIFNKLGFEKLLTINNDKHTYIHNSYEIVLEEVENLGIFLEVELCTDKEVDIIEIKNEIQAFIDSLNLNVSKELNMGKPEMMLKKMKGNN